MISPFTWLWNISHRKLLEQTRGIVDTSILINNINRKECECDLCSFLRKVVIWVEG